LPVLVGLRHRRNVATSFHAGRMPSQSPAHTQSGLGQTESRRNNLAGLRSPRRKNRGVPYALMDFKAVGPIHRCCVARRARRALVPNSPRQNDARRLKSLSRFYDFERDGTHWPRTENNAVAVAKGWMVWIFTRPGVRRPRRRVRAVDHPGVRPAPAATNLADQFSSASCVQRASLSKTPEAISRPPGEVGKEFEGAP